MEIPQLNSVWINKRKDLNGPHRVVLKIKVNSMGHVEVHEGLRWWALLEFLKYHEPIDLRIHGRLSQD